MPLHVAVKTTERFPRRNGLILPTDQDMLDIRSSVENVPPWTALELHRREYYDAHDLSSSDSFVNDSVSIGTQAALDNGPLAQTQAARHAQNSACPSRLWSWLVNMRNHSNILVGVTPLFCRSVTTTIEQMRIKTSGPQARAKLIMRAPETSFVEASREWSTRQWRQPHIQAARRW